jgi:hypothetical protein
MMAAQTPQEHDSEGRPGAIENEKVTEAEYLIDDARHRFQNQACILLAYDF